MRLSCLILISFGFVWPIQAQQIVPDASLLKSIYFSGGSYYISQQQAEDLKEWLESFPDLASYAITVHSHTDNIGSPEYNQMLAERRSYETVRYLLAFKISREMISIMDFGEFNPIYDNTTYRGRLMNRRVDVILWPRETM